MNMLKFSDLTVRSEEDILKEQMVFKGCGSMIELGSKIKSFLHCPDPENGV